MSQIGRYEIEREIGRGSMGVVYVGFDPLLKRRVAIKTVLPNAVSAEQTWDILVKRLTREAQAAASLNHPNIVGVYDVVPAAEMFSVVMEFVEGETLAAFAPPGSRATPEFGIPLLKECASALDHAHSRGIVHRDIKPANVMLESSGRAKIMDFGIAKLINSSTELTRGFAIGTLEYMSPEQLRAQPVDGRTDQFALGVVAYRLLTGGRIYDAETELEWFANVATNEPVHATVRNPTLPKGVDGIFARVLAKSANARYGSCAEFVNELERALLPSREPAESAPPAEPHREPAPERSSVLRPAKANAMIWALAAIGVLLVVLSIAYFARPFHGGSETKVQSAPTTPPPIVATNQEDTLKYVWVPPGNFMMGCVPEDHSCDEDEKPSYRVTIQHAFKISETEVTVAEYRRYARGTGRPMPPAPAFNLGWSHETHPIVNVTWAEASAYCEWAGGRLPTETEWEYAARGGIAGQIYVSGAAISPEDANFNGKDSFDYTAPVGSFPRNGFGLFDVSGNAAEWVSAEAAGGRRIVRGGSWNVFPKGLRLSKRVVVDPERRNFAFGMRCVQEAPVRELAASPAALPALGASIRPPYQVPDKPSGYVTDSAALMSETEINLLENRCVQLDRRHQAQIALVTVKSLEGQQIEKAALDLFRKWGIGRKGINDGLLLMLAIEDRKSRLAVGYGLEKIVTKDKAASILQAMRPGLGAGRYAVAFNLALDRLEILLPRGTDQ